MNYYFLRYVVVVFVVFGSCSASEEIIYPERTLTNISCEAHHFEGSSNISTDFTGEIIDHQTVRAMKRDSLSFFDYFVVSKDMANILLQSSDVGKDQEVCMEGKCQDDTIGIDLASLFVTRHYFISDKPVANSFITLEDVTLEEHSHYSDMSSYALHHSSVQKAVLRFKEDVHNQIDQLREKDDLTEDQKYLNIEFHCNENAYHISCLIAAICKKV